MRWPWVSGMIAAVVSLSAVAALILLWNEPQTDTDADSSENPFTARITADFTFDADPPQAFGGEKALTPQVNAVTPAAGTAGEKITISGSNFAGSALTAVSIGETELNIASFTDTAIEANIPYGAVSGEIKLDFSGVRLSAGYFEVLPLQKQMALEKVVNPSDEPQRIEAGDIIVTIPGHVLQSPQTLAIERIASVPAVNLPQAAPRTAFSVSLGDMHFMNDLVTIEYILPADMPGAPSAAYFNEETSLWDTLPSEMNGDRLYIYTDHLTDFVIFYWGQAIYSPDGYFKIYYEKDDTHTYAGSMDDLARMVGVTLEEARKDYEAKIPAAYREDFRYLGLFDAMDVYLDSGYTHGTYNAMTNNILLPTDYPNETDFETVLAHEFFHAYQDAVWSEVGVVGKMGASINKWAVEALAECAAYELAFPEKDRQRMVSDGVSSQEPYFLFNEVHEYSMACYLDYLLKKTGSTYEELWIYVAQSESSLIETSLDNFFRSKSSDFISLAYSFSEFWRDVAGDSDAPMQQALAAQFYARQAYLKPDAHTASFSYQTDSAQTLAFNMITVMGFPENMPKRIFDVSVSQSSENACWSTQVMGIDRLAAINDARQTDGYLWQYSHGGGDPDDAHELYAFSQGQPSIVLLALDCDIAGAPVDVSVREIQARCSPGKLDGVAAGDEYEFMFAFKDIFEYVSETRIEIDFGDGEVLVYKHDNTSGKLSGTVKHTFASSDSRAVTCSLYDISGPGKVLISELVIPVTAAEPTRQPEPSPSSEPTEPVDSTPEPTQAAGLPIWGTWRGIFDYMGYTDGYYFAETIDFHADGTFSSYFSAVTLDGRSEIPLDEEYTKDEGPFIPKSGTYTYDETTGKGTVYYTYLEYAKTFDFRYEDGQMTCGSWVYKKVE